MGKILAVAFAALLATSFLMAGFVHILIYLYLADLNPPISGPEFTFISSGVFSWVYWQMWKRC
jgi:hypothetical protein